MASETNSDKSMLHNKLSLDLHRQVTSEELKRLLHHFDGWCLGRREIENIKDFLDLWRKLDEKKIIVYNSYKKLEDAFIAIHATAHLHTIKENVELMKVEDGYYKGWVRDNTPVENVDELKEVMVAYENLLQIRRGVLLDNAAFAYVPNDGGKLQLGLKNGSAKLLVPPNEKGLHWIFRPSAKMAEGSIGTLSVKNSLQIVKYSLPVQLGPENVSFENPRILTLKDFSMPSFDEGSKKPMYLYKKKDGEDPWELVGYCFCDSNEYTATAQLKTFSCYVLGLPATFPTQLINVHVLVACMSEEYRVFFLLNDHSYIWEFVQKYNINVIREACVYLDPKEDVSASVRTINHRITEVVKKEQLQNLALEPILVIHAPEVSPYKDDDSSVTLVLGQGRNTVLRLSHPQRITDEAEISGCTITRLGRVSKPPERFIPQG